jgi:hypothetical protein
MLAVNCLNLANMEPSMPGGVWPPPSSVLELVLESQMSILNKP